MSTPNLRKRQKTQKRNKTQTDHQQKLLLQQKPLLKKKSSLRIQKRNPLRSSLSPKKLNSLTKDWDCVAWILNEL